MINLLAQRMTAGRGGRVLVACAVLAVVGLGGGCQRSSRSQPELADPAARISEARTLSLQAQEAEDDGKIDKAIELYQRSVRAYGDFPAAWNNLGVLLMKQGDTMGAYEAFSRAAELAPSDPRPAAAMGMIWQRLGYSDDALKAYEQALERDPSYQPALREAVLLAVQLDRITPTTAERARRAVMQEREARWLTELQRQALVIEQRLAMSGKDSGATP